MEVDLGDADAGVGVALFVLDDYIGELQRIGTLPSTIVRDGFVVTGTPVHLTVLLDRPVFELAGRDTPAPFTHLAITGTIQVRPQGQPEATPLEAALDAAVRLSLVLVPTGDGLPEVGLRYDGVERVAEPVPASALDELFADPAINTVLAASTMGIVAPLVEGLNLSRFPVDDERPADTDWVTVLTVLPGNDEADDAFAVTVGPPGVIGAPLIRESFVKRRTGMAVAYNRGFLDLMLARGAAAKVGTTVEGAEVRRLEMHMTDTAIQVEGYLWVDVQFPLPNVDIHLDGPMIPRLVRGTTGMAFDIDDLDVDVDDTDEAFYKALKWLTVIGAPLLLFSGGGIAAALGVLTWVTAVQWAWNGAADIEGAPNAIRANLSAGLGAALQALAESLDDDGELGEVRIDATPDSLDVVQGNMVFSAQIIVVAFSARMRRAEHSRRLDRFGIYVLEDGRRFRAQELARLVQAGKVTVPGFHHVGGNFLRADPDNKAANNLLAQFERVEVTETVVGDAR